MYFDSAATTQIDAAVLQAMQPWLAEKFANPSSVYQSGQEARAAIDQARMEIADFLGCKATEIFFTASGTEICNWAIRGIVEKKLSEMLFLPPNLLERGNFQALISGKRLHLIVSAIEHSAVLEMAKFLQQHRGIELTVLPVNKNGIIDLKELEKALKPETVLVSIMMVNNEIGSIQPIQEVGRLCRSRGVLFHTDACQAAGFFDLKVDDLMVDLLSMNAGKIYGPKGVGALYLREGVAIHPWTIGGGQEFRMHAGTENVAAIVGFGKAIELLRSHPANEQIKSLRNLLWKLIQEKISEVTLNGSWEERVPNNLNISLEGVDGESVVRRLDLMGIAVSTGSACASGTV